MTTSASSPPVATARTLGQQLLDRLVTRLVRLPRPTTDYTVTRDLRVPMRDGVDLLADMYTPTAGSSGTVLVRSPYGWPVPMAALTGPVFAMRGYRVVLARCRGTFGSGGTFEPMIHEVDDAADTVAWMREQPWFEGQFATYGSSYLGFTQWALLVDPPPELAAAVISVGPHDFRAAAYQGGAFNLDDFLGWSNQTARQEDTGFVRGLIRQVPAQRNLARAVHEVPLVGAGDALLEGRAPWYREWVSRRDPGDPFWSPMIVRDALERVEVPVLLQTGWQDLFLGQTLEQYARLSARGVDVALTVGPWTHIELADEGRPHRRGRGARLVRRALGRQRFPDARRAGEGVRDRRGPVARSPGLAASHEPRTLHLQPGGGLGDEPAPAGSRSEFTYDPADPTPTIGGRLLAPRTGGYTDDHALAARRDVVAFTGPPLRAPLDVMGSPVVEVAHSTDNPHADLFVRVSEVDPQERSRNVSDGFVRLDPKTSTGTIRLELDAVAHRFAAGNRIRIVIAGGSHPRWERNLGTDDDPATSARMVPSRRTIDLAASCVVLPVTA